MRPVSGPGRRKRRAQSRQREAATQRQLIVTLQRRLRTKSRRYICTRWRVTHSPEGGQEDGGDKEQPQTLGQPLPGYWGVEPPEEVFEFTAPRPGGKEEWSQH